MSNITISDQVQPVLTPFQKKLDCLCEALLSWKGYADMDYLSKLQTVAEDIKKKYDVIMTEDRNLKLGIVGRVKAGKSSFLNALLFDGQDILPKAATPMTAALTHISYAPSQEKQLAIVHYYSRDDWRIIEKKSQEYREEFQKRLQKEHESKQNFPRFRHSSAMTQQQEKELESTMMTQQQEKELESTIADSMPEELRVCHELVEMARGTIRHEELPRTRGLDDAHEIPFSNNMLADLKDYVAAEGKYTPMVKYLELKVHHKGLYGVEVTDTPGLNDPVTSRVHVTNKFLKQCDAVLLLSPVARFLDKEDYRLVQELGHAAVQEVYIIGTQMDRGILQYPERNVSLQRAYTGSRRTYVTQLKSFLDTLASHHEVPGRLLQDMETPAARFVSSLMYSVGQKKRTGVPLSENEIFILEKFKKSFSDYEKFLCTADDFDTFAGFTAIQEKIFAQIVARKNEIIKQKIANFEKSQAGDICSRLEDLIISALGSKSKLEAGDIASFKEAVTNIQDSLQLSRMAVHHIFKKYAINTQKHLMPIQFNLRQIMNKYKKIHEDVEVKTRTWSTGVIFKDYHSETYKMRTAKANDAAENIERYAQESIDIINNALGDILDSIKLESELRDVIYETFTAAKMDANKADICGPVQELVEKLLCIKRPSFSYSEEAKKQILEKFSSQVHDEEIDKLHIAQNEQLNKLFELYFADMQNVICSVKTALEQQGAMFIDDVCGKVKSNYNELTKQLQDKERHINLYGKTIEAMTAFKQDFAEIGR